MFKKIVQSLTKSLGKATPPAKPDATPAPSAAAVSQARATQPANRNDSRSDESALKKIVAPPAPAPAAKLSPEQLCGIDGRMGKDAIRDQLKLLYRRYNRAASSLDAKTRAEADEMLDAIVMVREKNFGEI